MRDERRSDANESELDYDPFSMSDTNLDGGRRALIRLVEIASGQQNLREKYQQYRACASSGGDFWGEAVKLLNIRARWHRCVASQAGRRLAEGAAPQDAEVPARESVDRAALRAPGG
jgi:hypothetical protein